VFHTVSERLISFQFTPFTKFRFISNDIAEKLSIFGVFCPEKTVFQLQKKHRPRTDVLGGLKNIQ